MNKFLYPIILFLTCSCGSTSYIHYAVMQNDLAGVKSYVDLGDIETQDGNGATPLIVAAYYGHAPIVKYLCDRGAKVDQGDYNGWTALMYASYYNFYNVAKILVDNYAAVDIVNSEGHTALFYAQEYQHDQIVMLLKENEKDLQIKKTTKSSPIKPAKKKIEKHKSAASLKPSIEIHRIETKPVMIAAGSKFDVEISYTAASSSLKQTEIPIIFTYAIIKNGKTFYEAKPEKLKVANGKSGQIIKHLTAKKKGEYIIRVSLRYKDSVVDGTVECKIQ